MDGTTFMMKGENEKTGNPIPNSIFPFHFIVKII